METLPPELHVHIASFLPLRDILLLPFLSRYWFDLYRGHLVKKLSFLSLYVCLHNDREGYSVTLSFTPSFYIPEECDEYIIFWCFSTRCLWEALRYRVKEISVEVSYLPYGEDAGIYIPNKILVRGPLHPNRCLVEEDRGYAAPQTILHTSYAEVRPAKRNINSLKLDRLLACPLGVLYAPPHRHPIYQDEAKIIYKNQKEDFLPFLSSLRLRFIAPSDLPPPEGYNGILVRQFLDLDRPGRFWHERENITSSDLSPLAPVEEGEYTEGGDIFGILVGEDTEISRQISSFAFDHLVNLCWRRRKITIEGENMEFTKEEWAQYRTGLAIIRARWKKRGVVMVPHPERKGFFVEKAKGWFCAALGENRYLALGRMRWGKVVDLSFRDEKDCQWMGVELQKKND